MERFVILKNPISVWPTMAEAFDFGLGIGDLGL